MSRPSLHSFRFVDVELPDVQAEAPAIALALDEAGISDLRYPITVHLADGSQQPTVATVSLRGQRRRRHARRPHEPLRREPARMAQPRSASRRSCACSLNCASDSTPRRRSRRFEFPLFLERRARSAAELHSCLRLLARGPTRAHRRRSARSRPACPSRASVPAAARSATTAHTTSAEASRSASSFDLSADADHVDFSDLVDVAESAVRPRSTRCSSDPTSATSRCARTRTRRSLRTSPEPSQPS